MADNLTISKVTGKREWNGQHGSMVTYKVELEQLEGVHELNQKPETPEPNVGESIFADVLPPNKEGFLPRLKKKQQQGGFGGGGWGGKSPEEQRKIQRQHSQEMAIRALTLAVQLGVIAKPPENSAAYLELVQKTADWFDKDIGEGKA